MGYHLSALVSRTAVLQRYASQLSGVRTIRLEQGFSLMPVTRTVYRQLPHARPKIPLPFGQEIPGELAAWAEQLAIEESVAYVFASYLGGIGGQNSVVWTGSGVWTPDKRLSGWPNSEVSQALRKIGVARGIDDEFDALDLGRYRHNHTWVARAIVDELLAQAAERETGLLQAIGFEHDDRELRRDVLEFALEGLGEIGAFVNPSPQVRALASTHPSDWIRHHVARLIRESLQE